MSLSNPYRAPVDTYLADLRAAMKTQFATITDTGKIARLNPMRTALRDSFAHHDSPSVMYQMIAQMDVSDDDTLQSLQTTILALSQWPAGSQSS